MVDLGADSEDLCGTSIVVEVRHGPAPMLTQTDRLDLKLGAMETEKAGIDTFADLER